MFLFSTSNIEDNTATGLTGIISLTPVSWTVQATPPTDADKLRSFDLGDQQVRTEVFDRNTCRRILLFPILCFAFLLGPFHGGLVQDEDKIFGRGDRRITLLKSVMWDTDLDLMVEAVSTYEKSFQDTIQQ